MKCRVIVAVAWWLPLSVFAQVPDKAQACAACHGQTGVSINAEWPNLAGQNIEYLKAQIKAFRDGVRESPVMTPFVSHLSDNDIEVLAVYYAKQPASIAIDGDSSLVQKGRNLSAVCTPCHGSQGSPVASEWPKLSGQHAAYLRNQLNLFNSGARMNSHMQAVLASLNLDDADFVALAAYYNQLQSRLILNQQAE